MLESFSKKYFIYSSCNVYILIDIKAIKNNANDKSKYSGYQK